MTLDDDIESWLKAKGYQKYPDERWRRPNRVTGQAWLKVDGGWLRFDRTSQGEVQEVYKAKLGHEPGMDKHLHPEAYEWLWPDEALARIFRPIE